MKNSYPAHSLRCLLVCALASVSLLACNKSDPKVDDKAASEETSEKSGGGKTKKSAKKGDGDEPTNETALKVKANFPEYDGTYDLALAEYSGVGFTLWFTNGCKTLTCDKDGFNSYDDIKATCPKGHVLRATLADKPNVVPPAGSYKPEVDVHGNADDSNASMEGDSKAQLKLTASSKKEVSGTMDFLDSDGNYVKGSFTAKVCPHPDEE